MASHRASAPVAALLFAFSSSCSEPGEGGARAYPIDTRDQWVGGPAADADIGDFILENDRIRGAILAEHCVEKEVGEPLVCSSPGPGVFGGSLADLDLKRENPRYTSGHGKDQFAEVFSTVNLNVTAVQKVSVISDGSRGGAAVIRAEGPSGDFISMIGLIGGCLGFPPLWITNDYILYPGDAYVTLRTTATITTEDEEQVPQPPTLDPCSGWKAGDEGLPCDGSLLPPVDRSLLLVEDLVAGNLMFGDFFLAGGDVDIFGPGIGFDEAQKVFAGFEAGQNSIKEPFPFEYVGGVGDGVSYAIGTSGTVSIPIFTSSQTAVFGAEQPPPVGEWELGASFTYQRFMAVGEGDMASALSALLDAYNDHGAEIPVGRLSGRVVEQTSMAPLSGVHVLVYRDTGATRDASGVPPVEDTFSEFMTDVGEDEVKDGSFGGDLPAGNYLLLAKADGRPVSQVLPVTVTAGETLETGLVMPRSALLTLSIVDERGRNLPAKVSLRPAQGGESPNRADLGDHYLSGGYTEVVFAPYGQADIDIEPGRYDILVSRGLEYGLWSTAVEGAMPQGVELAEGRPVHFDVVLPREVDSTGFVSADLHVHASPSHDSGVSLEMRAITMVCEGVEFLSSNDHDYLTDYQPVIDGMDMGEWLSSTVGLETTTIELGHFLGFPFQIDYSLPQDGAFDWTAQSPAEILTTLRSMGTYGAEEAAVFVGHPRDGILGYFDQYGLDPFEGERESPEHATSLLNVFTNEMLSDGSYFTLDFNGLELLNGKRMELVRTPTQQEIDCYGAARDGVDLKGCQGDVTIYDMQARTLAEQALLDDLEQPFYLNRDLQGQVDDWFTLLNLGYRHTALGNSDTHSTTSTEAGCPRNYIVSSVDEPQLVDEREIAQAVREHRVVASYGPLVNLYADHPETGIGSDVTASGGGVSLHIEVQAPRWMRVDRVELYENGRLIREWTGEGGDIDTSAVLKFETDVTVEPQDENGEAHDAWYVVSVLGNQDLAPVFTPVDIPPIELNDIVIGALEGLTLCGINIDNVLTPTPRFPRQFPVLPYALTNPIWVDIDGDTDGDGAAFEPLGRVPTWMRGTP